MYVAGACSGVSCWLTNFGGMTRPRPRPSAAALREPTRSPRASARMRYRSEHGRYRGNMSTPQNPLKSRELTPNACDHRLDMDGDDGTSVSLDQG